jgi:hypothetical protein
LGHGQQTGVQSVGSVHTDPVAPIFQFTVPATEAHVVSTFSLILSIDLGSVGIAGPEAQLLAAGGGE